jgi:hypothetical protein
LSFWDFAQPRLARAEGPVRRFGPTLLFVLVTLVALSIFRGQMPRFYPHWVPNSAKIYLPLLGMLAIAIAFYRTKYTAFVPLLSAILRASAVGLTVLLLIERPDYTLADPETATRAAQYVALGFYLAVGLSVLSWFRPAFILPVVIYLMSTRLLVAQISGVWMSYLDTRYMMDMAFYLIAFGLIVVKAGPRIHPWLAAPERQTEIVGVVFGLHLANYLWSGVAKLTLGPTPWYWMVENPTINQIPYTLESGILPIGHLPWLTDLAYQGFQLSYIPMNAAIVFAQLFALICVLRVSWLKIASLMYEALHIGIFILGGLFFWPWIWSNLTVWWAARTAKEGLSWNTKLACIATILLGAPALHINPAPPLAWFDLADSRQVYIEAVTKDGRHVKVPSAFFSSHSYSMSHAYLGSQAIEGQYDHTTLASSTSLERQQKDGQCVAPSTLAHAVPETAEARKMREVQLSRFLIAHHKKMLVRDPTQARQSYYFRFHHHPSNPFLYKEFNALSLEDVVAYQQVIESVCHSMNDGHVEKKVIARDTEYVSVL